MLGPSNGDPLRRVRLTGQCDRYLIMVDITNYDLFYDADMLLPDCVINPILVTLNVVL